MTLSSTGKPMSKTAIVLEQSDIKTIIAEKYGVDEKQVIKAQYSYIVVGAEEESDE